MTKNGIGVGHGLGGAELREDLVLESWVWGHWGGVLPMLSTPNRPALPKHKPQPDSDLPRDENKHDWCACLVIRSVPVIEWSLIEFRGCEFSIDLCFLILPWLRVTCRAVVSRQLRLKYPKINVMFSWKLSPDSLLLLLGLLLMRRLRSRFTIIGDYSRKRYYRNRQLLMRLRHEWGLIDL